jgi:hypothetical protein
MLISEIISGELAQDSIKFAEMSGYECPLMAQSGPPLQSLVLLCCKQLKLGS